MTTQASGTTAVEAAPKSEDGQVLGHVVMLDPEATSSAWPERAVPVTSLSPGS